MINNGIAFSRRVVEGLHPSSLANLGLKASLEILAREFAVNSGIAMSTHIDEVDSPEPVVERLPGGGGAGPYAGMRVMGEHRDPATTADRRHQGIRALAAEVGVVAGHVRGERRLPVKFALLIRNTHPSICALIVVQGSANLAPNPSAARFGYVLRVVAYAKL